MLSDILTIVALLLTLWIILRAGNEKIINMIGKIWLRKMTSVLVKL